MLDLVIRGRGDFSDFPCPPYIVDILFLLVEKRLANEGIKEPEDDSLRKRIDNSLLVQVDCH